MPWDRWILDASIPAFDGCACFCPIEGDLAGDYKIVTGMNYIGKRPPHGRESRLQDIDAIDLIGERPAHADSLGMRTDKGEQRLAPTSIKDLRITDTGESGAGMDGKDDRRGDDRSGKRPSTGLIDADKTRGAGGAEDAKVEGRRVRPRRLRFS